MQDKHYSDSELVAFNDGEIPPREAAEMQLHLDSCPACQEQFVLLRYELQGVSDQVQRLRPSPSWRERVRGDLLAYEEQLESERRENRPRRKWLMPALSLLAAACAVAVVVVEMPRASKPVVAPAATLARLNAFEASLSRAKVHQTFRVRTSQIRPAGTSRDGNLDVWSDGESGQFVSKWTTSAGVLKQALFHSGNAVSYTYGAQRPRHSNDDPPEAELLDERPNVEQFEMYFMHWLEKRPWKPIVLLPDLSLWERQGERIQMERVSATELRLTARRQLHDATLVFTAFLENGDDGPKLQVLRFESPQGVVELRLTADRFERVSGIPKAMFVPDRTPAYAQREPEPVRVQAPLTTQNPEDGERVAREIEILYALHNAGACLGRAVTVTQEEAGVLVAGPRATPDSAASSLVASSGPADVMAILADIRSAQRRQLSPGDDTIPAETRRHVQAMLQHSGALTLLAGKVPGDRMPALSARSRGQLGRMLADHARALEEELNLLAAAAPPGGLRKSGPHPSQPPGRPWQALARELGQEVEQSVASKAWLPPDGADRLATLAARAQALVELSRGQFKTAAAGRGPDQTR